MKKITVPLRRVFNWGGFTFTRPVSNSGKVTRYFRILKYISEQGRPVTHREIVFEVLKEPRYRPGLWSSGLTGMTNSGLLKSSVNGYEITERGKEYINEVYEIYFEIVSNL